MKNRNLIMALEARRRINGWTEAEMGTHLGMGQSHYNEFVNGKRRLSLGARVNAFKLGVSAEILLEKL